VTALTAEALPGASLSPLVRCSKPDIAQVSMCPIETVRERMKNVKHLSYYNCCHIRERRMPAATLRSVAV
jgi:hypothetical protein